MPELLSGEGNSVHMETVGSQGERIKITQKLVLTTSKQPGLIAYLQFALF